MDTLNLDSENLFFTSDLHFHHANILKFCSRPYENVDEMNQAIIDNWNDIVPKNGKVMLLGDVSWKGKYWTEHLLDQLNGYIYFIKGNHDKDWVDEYFEKRSGKIYDQLILKMTDVDDGGIKILHLTHYPLLEWYQSQRGGINIHGHCHGNNDEFDKYNTRRIDVGLDSHYMYPISWITIKEILQSRYYSKLINELPNRNEG